MPPPLSCLVAAATSLPLSLAHFFRGARNSPAHTRLVSAIVGVVRRVINARLGATLRRERDTPRYRHLGPLTHTATLTARHQTKRLIFKLMAIRIFGFIPVLRSTASEFEVFCGFCILSLPERLSFNCCLCFFGRERVVYVYRNRKSKQIL